jgi:signal transduction histidine kinase
MSATVADAGVAALVDRLAAHRTLAGHPRVELEWLAAHGEFQSFKTGEIVQHKGDPVDAMFIQFSGTASMALERGTGRRHLLDSHGGDVTALLPFSRLHVALGDAVVTEDAEALSIHRNLFPEMIRACPTVVETLVHVLIDRARSMQSTTLQDDKMAALGRLAAGLAHELNNPASAAARSAKLLNQALTEAHEASHALGAAHLSDEQRALIADIGARSLIPTSTGVFSAIERSDREDEITDWLDDHHADLATTSIAALAESGLTTETLDELADSFEGEPLDLALRWIAAEYAARSLASDVERATTRIYDLVSSVKRFTYMDRAAPAEPTNIEQGLADTVSMLASKARAKSVSVSVDVAPDLPRVQANPGELNQVWANLLENAIDAVGESGHIALSAARDGATVVVRVIDDGPGIPPEIISHIFDPFFTTKPIGQGTGLGLDISRQIIRDHDGQIAVDSRPGRTEFRVILPLEHRKNG